MKLRRVFSVGSAMLALAGGVRANVLMEVDFSGSGGLTTIAVSDARVVTHENLNCKGSDALAAVGGSLNTSGWNMDETGAAAVNADLHVKSAFGAPTRLDLLLGMADAGCSYFITNVEIVVRAASGTPKNWDFMYRDTSGKDHILSGTVIAVQSGTDPRTTYRIDLTGEKLGASSSVVGWDVSANLRVAFWEASGDNNDNLQIDAIRINGQVIPEPTTLGLISMDGGIVLIRRFAI